MAKPFLLQTAVSETISLEAGASVLLEADATSVSILGVANQIHCTGGFLQTAGSFTAGAANNVTIGNELSPTTLVLGQDLTLSANGNGRRLTMEAIDDAAVIVSSDKNIGGGDEPILISAPGQSLTMAQDGNLTISNPAGNATMTASQAFLVGTGNIFLNGVITSSQTQLGLANVVTLSSAATSYTTLSPTEVPGLNAASRLDIEANAAGTVVHSLFMAAPNPDGRMLCIQNTAAPGVGGSLTLVNKSASGTAGDRFLWVEDMVIPPGGGVIMTYDSTSPGFWFIRAIPSSGGGGASPLFDTVLDAGPFGFGPGGVNDNIPLALGQTTLIRYTVDSGSRQAGGLVNTNPGGNVEGMIVAWLNNGPGPTDQLIFVGNSSGSTANANRFFNAGLSNADGEAGGCVWYIYQGVSGVDGHWRELTNTSIT